MTISTKEGSFTGEGTPLNQVTGLTQAYKSSTCLKVTFKERIPPPTGVVNGPLMAIKYSFIAFNVSSGNHEFLSLLAFSPA